MWFFPGIAFPNPVAVIVLTVVPGYCGRFMFAGILAAGAFVFSGNLSLAGPPSSERFIRGLVDLRRGDLDGARKSFESELSCLQDRKSPYAMRVESYLLRVKLKSGSPDAITELRNLIERQSALLGREHPDTIASMRLLAGILEENGSRQEFEGVLKEVVESEKRLLGEKHLRVERTIKWLGKGGSKTADSDLSSPIKGLVDRTPEVSAMASLRQTTYNFHKEKYDQTIVDARNTIPLYEKFKDTRSKELSQLHLMLGVSLRIKGRYDEAIESFERVKECGSNAAPAVKVRALVETALAQYAQKKAETSVLTLRKAVDLSRAAGLYSEAADSAALLCRMLLSADKPDAAFLEVSRMKAEFAKSGHPVLAGTMSIEEARICLYKGEKERARKLLDEGLRATRGQALQQLEGLLLSATMLAGQDKERALSLLDEGLRYAGALEKRDAGARLSLERLRILKSMGKAKEAKLELARCLDYAARAGSADVASEARRSLD